MKLDVDRLTLEAKMKLEFLAEKNEKDNKNIINNL
jgi:hypothetical protein